MAGALEEKVLVVSGDPTVISPTQDVLREGYQLLLAKDGDKALLLFRNQRPLLVILDMDLPGLDGVGLMRHMNIQGDDLCSVIILRSDSCGSEIGECFDLGLNAFLKKPFNFYELKSLVRQAIDTRRIFLDLKREKEYARNLIDSALDMIIAVDAERRIKEFNRAAEETFGYTAQEVRGQPVMMLYSDPDEGERVRLGLQDRGRYSGEITCRRKNGELFPASLSAALLWDSKGRIIGSIGSSRDITEQKKIEEIKRAKVAAEIANKAKSSFLATMSHEIRSPMNAIIGMTDLALNTELTPEQRQYMQIVQQSSESLLCLLNDVLDFSKIEVGRLELERLPFSLGEVVEQTCDTMAVQAQNKNLELIWNMEPDLPVHLEGDPMRLRQILVNLIGNAIKFTRLGEVVVSMRPGLHLLPCEEKPDEPRFPIHFTVSDTGIGIPEEKQQAVFERFTQAENSIQRQFGGTGLGLAISRQLVRLMGGILWLESVPDQGSHFHFVIPFPVRQSVQKIPPITCEMAVFQRSVLVAAANDSLRHLLCRTLALWGHTVQEAKSGEEMLQTLSCGESGTPQRFDLLLLDCQLPDLMWINLPQWMEENPEWVGRTIKIVPSSGRHRKHQAGCMEVKAAATVSKPVSPAKLMHALNAAFDASRSSRNDDRPHVIRRSRHPLKVLLVDDDPGNLLTTAEMLRKAGHTVHTATDGREALSNLERDAFDLVLMDLQMPELDGLEATRIIRSGSMPAIRPDVPIMGITAYALKGDRERCFEAGMDEYLAKPFKIDDLLELTELFAQRLGLHERTDGGKGAVLQEEALMPPREAADAGLHLRRLGFLEQGGQLLDTLRFALNGRDPPMAETCAQQLKESAARVGAVRVKSAAFRIVMAVRKEDFSRAEAQMDLLVNEFRAVDALLRTPLPA